MRDVLWVGSAEEARLLVLKLVEDFGDVAVDSEQSALAAIPIDISFGAGDPVLPGAPDGSVARKLLERYLPSFVLDVRRMLQLHSEIDRNEANASFDSLN